MGREILTLPAPPYDHKIAYGGDPHQFGYLRLPKSKGPHPVALVIHGGFWRAAYDLEHSGHLCAALTACGVATWSLEYRRIGNSGGGWPGTFEDVVAGAAHVQKMAAGYGLNAGRTIAVGHSAGGHLALLLGSQSDFRLRGVVALAAVTDLKRAWELKLSNAVVEELMGGPPGAKPAEYVRASPVELVSSVCPVRLIHGGSDNVVPIEFSQTYKQMAEKHRRDVRVVAIPDADHFDLIDPRSVAWPRVETAALDVL